MPEVRPVEIFNTLMFENNIADENVSSGQVRNLTVKNTLFNQLKYDKGKLIGEFRQQSCGSPSALKFIGDLSAMASKEA